MIEAKKITRDNPLAARLGSMLSSLDYAPDEIEQLTRLMCLLKELPPPPDPFGLFQEYAPLKESFVAAIDGADPEALEETFLMLYAHLHGYEAPYTAKERRRVDETGGYWCHAGGLAPILKSTPYIGPDTVSGEFGAGNGLQTLLMQWLTPHERTVMVEISSRMVEAGKQLQSWLCIPKERVEWNVKDVLDISPAGMDFIYLYRPVRPEGHGRLFYERFAGVLEETDRPVVIFSVADCLRSFLSDDFKTFYGDGHLTCYRRSAIER